jgi:hypothetical protein
LFSFAVPRADTGLGASAGGVSDDLHPHGQKTSLELALDSAAGSNMAVGWQEEQRGYWWITVLPPEIAGRFCQPGALAASGVFHEVSELPDGSVWLRATPTISEFTGDRIRRVFEVLAPVLVTGTTSFRYGARYRIVEGAYADFRLLPECPLRQAKSSMWMTLSLPSNRG